MTTMYVHLSANMTTHESPVDFLADSEEYQISVTFNVIRAIENTGPRESFAGAIRFIALNYLTNANLERIT